MDIEISLEEPEELRCSDLDLPMLTSKDLTDVFMSCLQYMTEENLDLLAGGHINSDMVLLLFDLCHNIIDRVYNLVLDVVVPQLQSWTCGQTLEESAIDHDNTSVTVKRIEPPQDHYYHTVTEDDIQASLGDSLHQGIGGVFGVEVERSDNSDQLLQLVAAIVAKEVNRKLADITQPHASQQPEELCESPTKEMVYHVAKILEKCVFKNRQCESTDEGCTSSNSSEASSLYEVTMEEEFDTEERQCPEQCFFLPWVTSQDFLQGENTCLSVSHDNMLDQIEAPDQECLASELSQASSPDEKTMVEEFSSEATEDYPSEFQCSDYKDELSQGEKTFLAVFLSKLLDHIAHSTNTSVLDLKFNGNFQNLKRTLEGTSFTLPQTIGDLHLTTFKKLCREFGSGKLLQAGAVSGGSAFKEAVASELKRQLQKTTRKPLSFGEKVRKYFRRQSNKTAPACEVGSSVSHRDVAPLEDGSTLLPQKKQKRPAIIGMFSAVARILRKPFNCHCSGSQED